MAGGPGVTSADAVTARWLALWQAQAPIWSGWLGRGGSSRQRGRWGVGIGVSVATLGGGNRLEVAPALVAARHARARVAGSRRKGKHEKKLPETLDWTRVQWYSRTSR